MQEIAEVYARALFEVAQEHDTLDRIHEEIGDFTEALDASEELRVFFFSPYFSSQEKKDGIAKLIEDADENFVHFLELLAERHRLPVIFRIRRRFDELWREERKLLQVTVTSAVDLDDELLDGIGSRVEEQTGRKVELSSNVDPDVLGGIVLRVGNMVLDASVRHRLDQLRKRVATAA